MNSNPEILDEIKANPELLRILTKSPVLFHKILLASAIFEQYENMRANYLTESSAGFEQLLNFIARLEIPINPMTGDGLTDEGGTRFIFPLVAPTGAALCARFAKWIHQRFYGEPPKGDIFDQAVSETQTGNAEPAQAAPAEKGPYVM